MRVWAVVTVLGLSMASPSAAQDLFYSFHPTTDCLSAIDEGDEHRCIGAAARHCMEANEGGTTTVGMSSCLVRELDDWEARLNRAYGLLMTRLKAEDNELATLGSSAPKQAPTLLAMQHAWNTYRDTACTYERAKWGGGTGSGPAATSCFMLMTARQALSLENDLNGYGEKICNHEGC